jgi:trehalose 6-phosphate synthase/phosphatase
MNVFDRVTTEVPRGRVLLVSNRLPVSITPNSEPIVVRPSPGGLVTGLRSVHGSGASVWVGWPGVNTEPGPERERVEHALPETVVPVHFTTDEMSRFYDGVANGVIWPLFHYLLDRVPGDIRDWAAYESANQRFADVVAKLARPDDLIWVQDYHLLLLPALLRARLPRARIGFFLHIPFPSSEVFRILPYREAVLDGLLGADLIGFHTFNDQRHFSAALLSVLGFDSELDRVEVEGRSVRLAVFPMGVDAAAFAERAADPAIIDASEKLRAAHAAEKLLLGIDRLDYTKGLTRKFLAIERLLERSPQYRSKLRLLQVAVPSRENVSAYRELKREIEEIAGRINGAHATLHSAPIHYVYDSVDQNELVASYRAADVMLVTPLRDGMNLVAKEYVASRIDGDGVLVLSEFAGAASELAEALVVNPYDVAAIAGALERALEMEEPERRRRMQRLREKVEARPVELWASSFLSTLRLEPANLGPSDLRRRPEQVMTLAEEIAERPELVFALDYDGTLVPIASTPQAAAPDPELLELLERLAACPGVRVAVVSGRTLESLARFLGRLPVALVAEHGVWSRAWGGEWQRHVEGPGHAWRAPVLAMLEDYCERTPGSFVEQKTVGLAWHYRNADRQLGAARARELRLNLAQILARQPASVIGGRKVVEVRPQEADKGLALKRLLADGSGGETVVAMGDDRSDEELFRAATPSPYTFAASSLPTHAHYRIDGPSAVRALLARFLERRRALFASAGTTGECLGALP